MPSRLGSISQRALKYRLFGAVAALAIVLDQATKLWVSEASGIPYGVYPPDGGIPVIPGFLSIVYCTNSGAAWGMFSGQGVILAILGIVAVVAIVLARRHLELERRTMQLVFGLICGGILGNLVDRLRIGRVIDFIDADLGFYRWPTFNIADSCLVVGVALFTLLSLCRREEPPPPAGQ